MRNSPCNERVPDAHQITVLDSFDDTLKDLGVDEDSYLVIVTRGHAHDKTVLEQALRTPARYIGMIGSRRKTKLIFESLLAQGFSQEDIQRVSAPIGLPIGGETPEEIGVSIIAQMVQPEIARTAPSSWWVQARRRVDMAIKVPL